MVNEPLVHASGVSFAYGARPAVAGVDVALQAGEVVAVLGPNGSGKSTLIKVLLGHLRGSGDVKWQGRDVRAWGRRELARTVAYLPQSPSADGGETVADVLRMGRSAYWGAFGIESTDDVKIVEAVCDRLHIDRELLGRRIEALSGGQQQRVFIGRCLVQEPKALLLDEPNTYLDLRHQVELLRLLRDLARERGIGVLMASHDLNLAGDYADRLLVMSTGKKVAEGTPDHVLRPEVLESVYGVRLQRVDRPGARALIVPTVDV
jgi:iron complex transport system ATP-binding protein